MSKPSAKAASKQVIKGKSQTSAQSANGVGAAQPFKKGGTVEKGKAKSTKDSKGKC